VAFCANAARLRSRSAELCSGDFTVGSSRRSVERAAQCTGLLSITVSAKSPLSTVRFGRCRASPKRRRGMRRTTTRPVWRCWHRWESTLVRLPERSPALTSGRSQRQTGSRPGSTPAESRRWGNSPVHGAGQSARCNRWSSRRTRTGSGCRSERCVHYVVAPCRACTTRQSTEDSEV
jgi:hypothetical protein